MKTEAVRMAFTSALLEAAKQDRHIFAVTTDSRGSVTLGDFSQQLPQQFVEIGIAEQNAIGVSAGLANAGLRPFVCGPACFWMTRWTWADRTCTGFIHNSNRKAGLS